MSRLFLAAIPLLAACSSSVPMAPDEVTTDAGVYMLMLDPSTDSPAAGEDFMLSIMVHDAGDMSMVGGADLSVEPFMPDMGHGIPDEPTVMEMTDSMGMYDTTFQFSMAGYWEVTVSVDGEPGTDEATFAYEVQ